MEIVAGLMITLEDFYLIGFVGAVLIARFGLRKRNHKRIGYAVAGLFAIGVLIDIVTLVLNKSRVTE